MTTSTKERPRHLGRGLQSLLGPISSSDAGLHPRLSGTDDLPNLPPDKELRQQLREIAIDTISPNPYQVREVWDRTGRVHQGQRCNSADCGPADGLRLPAYRR